MAHIRRHPVDSSKWQVRYIDPNRRERSKTFRRKVDAEKFLIQVESQKQRGEWIDPDLAATPFADWAHSWITTRTHLKPKTLDGYQSLLRIHIIPEIRRCSSRPDRWSLDRAVGRRHAGGGTVCLEDPSGAPGAVSDPQGGGPGPVHPRQSAEGIPLPRKPRREQLFLMPAEVDRLADAVDQQYRALIYVLVLRRAEMG